MSSPRFDGSTLDLSRTGTDVLWGDLAFEPIPTLTILFHPQAVRVGARAYLGQIVRGQEARLSRLEPDSVDMSKVEGGEARPEDPAVAAPRPFRLREEDLSVRGSRQRDLRARGGDPEGLRERPREGTTNVPSRVPAAVVTALLRSIRTVPPPPAARRSSG